MMPIVEITGSREKPKGVKLISDDATEILAGPKSGFFTIESIRYCCGGTPTDLTLWYTDGTSSWNLLNAYEVPANSNEPPIGDHIVLKFGWSLMAQAANANQIDITAVFVVSGQSGTS